MCRLFGLVASTPVEVMYFLRDARHSLKAQAAGKSNVYPAGIKKNMDGWGVAWAAESGVSFKVEKQGRLDATGKEHAEKEYAASIFNIATPVKARIALAHVRKASRGIKITANAHPFLSSGHDVAFVHNGTINCKDDLFRLLTPGHGAGLDMLKSTDSEILFRLILQYRDVNNERLSDAILHAISDTKREYSALNFLLATAEELYIFSSTTRALKLEKNYFTLHCSRWTVPGSRFQAL
nr:class II glutamine amidotransferase [Candidatus Sigynarchaeota archaeon]